MYYFLNDTNLKVSKKRNFKLISIIKRKVSSIVSYISNNILGIKVLRSVYDDFSCVEIGNA